MFNYLEKKNKTIFVSNNLFSFCIVRGYLKGIFASDQVGMKVKTESKLLALAFVLSAVLEPILSMPHALLQPAH
jgi:hypothetical protein